MDHDAPDAQPTSPRMQENAISLSSVAELLNDSCHDQIFAVDRDLRIIAWNKACVELAGVSRHDALGKSFEEALPDLARRSHIRQALSDALNGRKTLLPREGKEDGNEFYEYHFIPLLQEVENHSVTGVLISVHNITRSVMAEYRLQDLNEDLALKNRHLTQRTAELAQFNEVAAEDLKGPLRKIYSFIELVLNNDGTKISNSSRNKLRRAQGAVQRVGLMTDDMVRFSQIASSERLLMQVDLNEIHRNAMLAQQKILMDSGVTVDAMALPTIIAFPDLIQYLWNYMIENMLTFPDGGQNTMIGISYSLVNGCDILSEEVEKSAMYHQVVFHRRIPDNPAMPGALEKQAAGETSPEKLKGIGFAICRKIAAAHEGFIMFDSHSTNQADFSCYFKKLEILA